MKTHKERYRLVMDRVCFVCRKPVATPGTLHSDLMILTHYGSCTERVGSLRRINDRSSRGRWRPIRQLLRLLEGTGR